jgi:hypothetical protein
MYMVYAKRPGQKRFLPLANVSTQPWQTDRLVYASRWKRQEDAEAAAVGMAEANPGCIFEARPIRARKKVSV